MCEGMRVPTFHKKYFFFNLQRLPEAMHGAEMPAIGGTPISETRVGKWFHFCHASIFPQCPGFPIDIPRKGLQNTQKNSKMFRRLAQENAKSCPDRASVQPAVRNNWDNNEAISSQNDHPRHLSHLQTRHHIPFRPVDFANCWFLK